MNQIKPNIGLLNALVRITCGFTMLAWSTARLVKRQNSFSALIVAKLGAMKVAEGFTRFCPLTYVYEERMANNDHHDGQKQYDDLVNPS